MTKIAHIAAALSLSLSGALAAAENGAIAGAGLSLAGVEAPPAAQKSNMWMTLRKIQLNTADPGMNDTLVGLVDGNFDAYVAVRELTQAGFKVKSYQSNTGGYMVFADVTGEDAADWAIGLARYYYITEVRVGQKVYEKIFPSRSKSTYAVTQGTVKGGMNYSQVDLKLDKRGWTIKGGINNSPADLKIDHDAKTITGGANLSPVALKFDWSAEQVRVYGGANRSPVDYTVNWKGGLLEGLSNNSPVRLEFDLGQGYADQTIVGLKGYANHAPVELTFNKVNGHLGGYMNHAPVDVNLVNCDIYDFLQYFFLFLK